MKALTPLAERWVGGGVLIAVFAVAIVREHATLAQGASSSCAQIATAAERLACYDRALPPTQEAPATTVAPSGMQPAAAANPIAVVSPAAAPEGATDAEQTAAVPVVVVGMRKYPGRSATFTTDTGEVWIQIGGEGVYLPKVPFHAELRPASMGTYFLRPSEYGWRVHVRPND